jgi:predicted dehydrogenase
MTKTKVRIGLVGVANHGNTILQAIIGSSNLELVSCYDVDENAMQDVAARYGVIATRDYDTLVNDDGIDAVALVTPNHLHRKQVRKAADNGKHVFLEKPIANTVEDGKEIIKTMNNAGRILSIGHNTRRKLTFRKAKQLLNDQIIGRIVGIEANLSRPAGLQEGLPSWKADEKTCPLLPMMQLGIHFVDTIRYLCEPVRSVSCIAGRIAMHGNVYDSTAALLHLQSGIPAALSSYYISPETYFMKIYGTHGVILCKNEYLKLEVTEDHQKYTRTEDSFPEEGMKSYKEEMTEFADCIIGNKQPETSGEVGLEALAVIEAMVRAVESGRIESIDDILITE